MSVQGLCQVCESAPATFACERCGALVCEDHYVDGRGLCRSCASETGHRRDRPGSGDDRLR
ncbi:MAG: hypothetical protein ABEJ76_07980 [Halanaeroarchaeum sp.]